MKTAQLMMILAVALVLSACSHFTRPLEQPVIEEKLNKSLLSDAEVGTLSLTPERRVVLANFSNGRFCAEAPTEVGVDISRLLKIAAEASKGDEFKAGLEAISAAASSNAVLNKRTQGMQLYLASSYFLCQMYMNGAIDEFRLVDLQLRTLNAVAPLIEKEIGYMYQAGPEGVTGSRFVPLDVNEALQEVQQDAPQEPLQPQ